ncbi:hypothetical protein M441DRAFT_444751 [Trichoderma asperellum CBS 433.97]|uniref:Uncharacterized protein n=1 Tax=Trichoderma asperellum (strain ATCC 204424 / CBS 433.97 / NBRC 101777) TaxID=1042311 RepID=A0A2T3ZN13_TRIA4|nr:hypothetical protein M441DRAFT_444751 [Trichoderma asperellum CBS 433.97]PTB46190.1 hypothetical protein M441DRAFT_444751 [Trichoderma asperellum CBS 433.97]
MALAPAKEKGPERKRRKQRNNGQSLLDCLLRARWCCCSWTRHLTHVVRPTFRDGAGAVQHQLQSHPCTAQSTTPATDFKVLISAAHPVISAAPSCTRSKSRLARDSRRIRRRHTQIPCSNPTTSIDPATQIKVTHCNAVPLVSRLSNEGGQRVSSYLYERVPGQIYNLSYMQRTCRRRLGGPGPTY